VDVSEDPMTGPNDRRGFPLDEVTVEVTITGEDGIDDSAFIELTVRSRGG